MRKAAEVGVVNNLARRLAGKLLPIIAGSLIFVSGVGEMTAAIADSAVSLSADAQRVVSNAPAETKEFPAADAQKQSALADGVPDIAEPTAQDENGKAEADRKLRTPLLESGKTRASRHVTESFIDKTIGIESGGKADAKNPNSTALGQGQFIKSTWLRLVDTHKPSWAEGLDELSILEMRKEPDASRWAIRLYAEANVSALSSAGVAVSHAALYLSHMLDGPVAARLFKARPNTLVKDIVGAAAFQANKALMKGKRAKELIAWAQRKMGERFAVAGAGGMRQSSNRRADRARVTLAMKRARSARGPAASQRKARTAVNSRSSAG